MFHMKRLYSFNNIMTIYFAISSSLRPFDDIAGVGLFARLVTPQEDATMLKLAIRKS